MASTQPTGSRRLAVCSWSLQPENPADLVQKLSVIGIKRIQLELDPLRESPTVWGNTAELLKQQGITVTSGMLRCAGEDYSSLESIRLTGGIAPDATWPLNLNNFAASAAQAAQLGLKLITLHAGFFPHASEPGFLTMEARLETIADIFSSYQIALGLETGQETAAELADFLRAMNHPNIGVNFDPANMLLYDKGDPVEALRILAPWLQQIHIKDATRTKIPGTWGEEVPVGTGEVNWPAFFATLGELGFSGDLVIEREAGTQRIPDIVTASNVVTRFL